MKKLIDLTVKEYVLETDSASPAPGGGSASALAGALGMALGRMVGHLTIPKKKFQTIDEAVQQDIINAHEMMKKLEQKMLDCIDADTAAFNAIMAAIKMPKDTDDDKALRAKKLAEASIKAAQIPLDIATIAHDALLSMKPITIYGNKNALSDIGVSVLMLKTALEGAVMNVRINLPGITDDTVQRAMRQSIDDLFESGTQTANALLKSIYDRL